MSVFCMLVDMDGLFFFFYFFLYLLAALHLAVSTSVSDRSRKTRSPTWSYNALTGTLNPAHSLTHSLTQIPR